MSPATELRTLPSAAGDALESLYEHRLLSTRQIHRMHTPESGLRWTRVILAGLRRHGLVDFVRVADGHGSVYFLTLKGARTVEPIASRSPARRKLIGREQAAGPLRAHTLAVNDVGVAFMQGAREHGDEFGALAWRHEVAHPLGRRETLIADALLAYLQHRKDGGLLLRYRLLELDRANSPAETLTGKLSNYARLYRYTPATQQTPGWRARYDVFPDVICVLAGDSDDALERRRQSVLALCRDDRELRQTPQVGISICLHSDLVAQGPFAAIWQSPGEQRRRGWLDTPQARRKRKRARSR